jgi:hypothetical protein
MPARRRAALELLASCRDGCTEAIMVAHGFTIADMVKLVRAGLATATGRTRRRRLAQDGSRDGPDHGCGAAGVGGWR